VLSYPISIELRAKFEKEFCLKSYKFILTALAILLLSGCEKSNFANLNFDVEHSEDGLIKVVDKSSEIGKSFKELGDESFTKGEFVKAIEQYSKALERQPENIEVLNSRGVTHNELGNFVEAEADFTKALELMQKRMADLYENRGYSKLKMREFSSSINEFHKALEFNSELISAKINLGVAHKRAGNSQEAFEIYNSVIESGAKVENSSWKKSEPVGIEY
jgi:tetratricopeptide (TPR) repeat protein